MNTKIPKIFVGIVAADTRLRDDANSTIKPGGRVPLTASLGRELQRVPSLILACAALAGCGPKAASPLPAASQAAPGSGSLAIALAPQPGDAAVDQEIRRRQQEVRDGVQLEIALERLGWLFVAKARGSFDPGYYKIAEQCALELEARHPRSPESLLLRAHVSHNLHRFDEAEAIARELVAARGLAFDFGVLGDALMERGRINEAIAAYQSMADLKPDLHAQARAAHVRWLKGDLEGAIEMMQAAASAVSSRDAETAAWMFTRLAGYQFQAGAPNEAAGNCKSALDVRPEYPPALLLRGKMLLAADNASEAASILRLAEKLNPLPEYQWALADALRAAGNETEAVGVEARLRRSGTATDPRTFSLFLATRGEKPELAIRLAREELKSRGDVFTHDALAWALFQDGKGSEAQSELALALSEGTRDARLFLHAAAIAAGAGHDAEATAFCNKTAALRHLLLPSERRQLHNIASKPSVENQVVAAGAAQKNFSTPGN